MAPKDGGPAFPRLRDLTNNDGPRTERFIASIVDGMTLRDYFAAQALVGLSSGDYFDGPAPENGHAAAYAQRAYEIADAMLEQREKA